MVQGETFLATVLKKKIALMGTCLLISVCYVFSGSSFPGPHSTAENLRTLISLSLR